jgi:glycosyltransferase involved in cell wall biosynthesis
MGGVVRVLAMLAAYPPHRSIGSWIATHNLLRALVARGHDVDVLLESTSGEPYELDGVRVWPRTGKSDPFGHLEDADVIVCHAGGTGRPEVLGKLCGIPVVVHVHSVNVLTKATLLHHRCALTVFNSASMAVELGGYVDNSVTVRPPITSAEYATTPGEHVTLVGLSRDKGSEVFYALAERLPQRKFLGVQGGHGVQVLDDLPNVEIVPHMPSDRMRDDVYSRTRILLMPSAHESYGRAGVEAMCSGIPVIAHPTDGLREALGDAGVFVDRNDLDGWENALHRLLDGRRWRHASNRAKHRATELDPAAEIEAWCRQVEHLASSRSRVRAALRRTA